MPSLTRLARIARLATLPETRGVIIAAARSEAMHDIARRAANDRAGLVRDLSNPTNARGLLLNAARHPAARELASASLMLLPWRYLPLGWAATWAADRLFRHPTERPKGSQTGPIMPPQNRLPV